MPDIDPVAVAAQFAASDFVNDLPQLMELVAPLIDYDDAVAIAQALELCPVHFCDEQICADDDREDCRATRALLAGDGTSGQDRESYTDTQDRKSYTVDEA